VKEEVARQARVIVVSSLDGVPLRCLAETLRECELASVVGAVLFGGLRPVEDVLLQRVRRVEAEFLGCYLVVSRLNGALLCVVAGKEVSRGRLHIYVRVLKEEVLRGLSRKEYKDAK